jgi:hypothetical protein
MASVFCLALLSTGNDVHPDGKISVNRFILCIKPGKWIKKLLFIDPARGWKNGGVLSIDHGSECLQERVCMDCPDPGEMRFFKKNIDKTGFS